MTKPIKLATTKNEPNERIVKMLEDWLKWAKAGHLEGIAITGQFRAQNDVAPSYFQDWTTEKSSELVGQVYVLLGKITEIETSMTFEWKDPCGDDSDKK